MVRQKNYYYALSLVSFLVFCRVQREEIAQSESDARKTKTIRPHIRKGHWHGYWEGSGQDKHYVPKWLAAIFVNAAS